MGFCAVGGALVDVGETMTRLAEFKDSLDIDVKQNFIDPLQTLCEKDLREIHVMAFLASLGCRSLFVDDLIHVWPS